MSGVNYIAVKSANNLFLNTLPPQWSCGYHAQILVDSEIRNLYSLANAGQCASVSAPVRIRISSRAHPNQLPSAFASAPVCIRISPHAHSRLPPCSPNLLFLESALLMANLLTTNRNCGGLRDENDGLEHKKQGSRLFIGVKKSYCGKILISLPII